MLMGLRSPNTLAFEVESRGPEKLDGALSYELDEIVESVIRLIHDWRFLSI